MLKAIHELLLASFKAEELERFCRFHDPFAPVVHQFAPHDGPADRVDKLLVFCQTRDLLDRLLADLARERPDMAERIDRLRRREPARATRPGELPAGLRLPFDRNALFTGRAEVLERLARGLMAGDGTAAVVTQAIHGMGGVGKTQLAVEFAYRYGHRFRGVHWVNAREPAGIAAEIAACGEWMGVQPWPAEQTEQVAATLAAWRDGGPRLVVLDNLEDVAAAREWLRRLRQESGARVLLTARRGDWPRDLGLAPLRLDVFSAEESLAFLRQYLPPGRANDDELEALAERLGRLPLALELAGRYLAGHRRLTVGDYLARLDRALDDPSMKGWRVEMGNPTGQDLDLMATFAVSWAVDEIGPAARRAFRAASWCAANEPIPCALLERAAGLETEACDEALAQLVGLGLLTWPAGEAGPAIHPLLGEFGQAMDRLQPKGESALVEVAEALNRLTYDALESGLPGHFAPLRAHAEVVAPAAEGAGAEAAGALWNNLGYHLQDIADLARARAAFQRALAILEKQLGPEHPQVAIGVNNLGSVLRDLGDLAGARAAHEQALAIDEQVYGPEHPDVARDVNNLGGVLRDLGDPAGARAALERALAIFEQYLPAGHPNIETVRRNLADVKSAMESDGP